MERQEITQAHLEEACGYAKLVEGEVICNSSSDFCEYLLTDNVEHLSNMAACPVNPYVKGTIGELSQKPSVL